MSLVQWKAIFDRLKSLEERVAELERQGNRSALYNGPLVAPYVAGEREPHPVVQMLKRGPGRPRKVIDGQN